MQILLILPPTDSAIKKVVGTTGPPLGLAYLASMVRGDHDVRIIDGIAEELTFEDVMRILKKYDPDVVGITATTSAMYDAYAVAKIAKNLNENVFVVMGGPHVTFTPELTMRECPCIDAVVRGEGELTFKELVDALDKGRPLKGILGLSYQDKEAGKIRNEPPRPLIQNVDEIPIPTYDLLPMDRYRADGTPFGTIMTSRGCPFNCAFCSSSLQFGKRWRGHSVERVIEELSILRNEYGRREIEFLDDTFTLNKVRAVKIAEAIKREGLDITWTASSRVNTFNEKVAKAMKEGGCHTVYFGIESGSQRTLDFIGKGITPQQSLDAVKLAKKMGLHALGSFIIGFPEETREEIERTIKFAKKVGVDFAQFTVATPYPGTRLWQYAIQNNLLLTRNWRKYTTIDPVMKLKYFTPEQIAKLLRKAYLSFYLRPKVLLRDIIERHGFIFRRAIRGVLNIYYGAKRNKDAGRVPLKTVSFD
ncbi:B12-binding domain-containing radical SAM protein [Thermococcus sp. Bubb.Bath]|uniref:B12-binding domain-containing radical SAM protein n=1 Tax=Thermococcus sp. Bubb.Bath TaxID=1638242 RepID=UPI00143AFDBF|nr:radical SAM protein [Thermococcus sp. Bubb.Bath]NJF26038.1 radical SAM protein [Thermococcus sp. Bubb.Bath]